MGVHSSTEREKVIWQIGREVDLLSEADEGERFCRAINVQRTQHSHCRTAKS